MSTRNDDGYILASALAVLLAISLVAAALVSTSADGLRRIRQAEADAAAELALRSALTVVASQLAMDPRRRQVDFAAGDVTLDVLDRTIGARIFWETARLDVNRASPDDVDKALADAGVDVQDRGDIRRSIAAYRARNEPIALLDDVLPGSREKDCLYSLLTVFGGQPDYRSAEAAAVTAQIGRPAAGARLAIELRLTGEPGPGIAAIVMMTGDPAKPAEVLDWRKVRAPGEKRCHEA